MIEPIKTLKSIDRFITVTMKTIIISVTTMCTLIMTLQVIVRYVFQISISGLDELAGHTAVWLYLIGSAYGTFDRSQIKADMLHLLIKNQRILDGMRVITSGISVVVCGYLAVWSFQYAQWSILKHEATPTLQIPTVIFQISFLVGAVLMVIYFVAEMTDQIRLCLRGRANSK